MHPPYLPQKDNDKAAREAYLKSQQDLYLYDYEHLPPLVLMDKVPDAEHFSSKYIAERVLATSELLPNTLAMKARAFLDPLDELKDYEDFFPVLPLPEVSKVYQTDDSFGEQRLAGVNPMVLALLKQDDARGKLLKEGLKANDGDPPLLDLDKEIKAGNIYVADYTGKDSRYLGPSLVRGGGYAKGRKYLPKPLAFFWWQSLGIRDRGKLVPIAIQLSENRKDIYTPFEKNPLDWLFAKLCVQVADSNHHEMSSHLCRTHFVMEPIAIGTARQLAENHPLSLLLRPHFRFMLTNNHLGQERLINRGGSVDQLLAGTLPESMELVKDAYKDWNLKDFAFPEEVKNRGMGDDKRLPHYPYRDDGMLVWNAIHTFVSGYLNHFYQKPQDVIDDTELQAWVKELSDQKEGGKVKGMPSQFSSVDELIEIITTIIFICGPQHSAVNFAQYDYMAFVANMPLAAYWMPDARTEPAVTMTENQLLQFLPPHNQTAEQLQTLFVLSAYRYDRLGYYDKSFKELYRQKLEDIFGDSENEAIVAMVMQFQQNLNMAEQKIDANNQKRVVAYPFLKPSLILNSISI
ncbi:MAG: lipoxygenase family protein [Cyanobacteria bacterium J06627_3]